MTMVLERSNTLKHTHHPGTLTYLDTSVAEIEASLAGVSYPAIKWELIRQAMRNGATPDAMAFFNLLPATKYDQFQDIASLAWAFLVV
ncbi:DUF2795 domain-containing protein [Dehalogenimonas alkenigignens]|uniref:DUF2795 domain-containing protein n=1 Tax=Dehalogenimonas alkenigignens TaxID=1217799 RepID=UPI000D56FBC1|nr:DUF2795 domain-containing protein [Dehalogenimonas alkenigignens]PVV83536.1 hypothetical protein DD509_06815 [Dehalogenimonas alkenigignens]